ncbi:MAG: IS982 family transposase, partial [bacterium]
MDLETFIVATYCLIDEALTTLRAGRRVRQRGPHPTLADSEVLTMEVVGEYLGLDQDAALFAYFRRHHADLFPGLATVHRTTFVRQAANLWRWKEQIWQALVPQTPHDPGLSLVDSFPIPVCRFARASRCRLFRGEAAFGHDHLQRQTFYGFRLHVRCCQPGIIAAISLAPANASDLAVLPELVDGTHGFAIGDRNYWSPELTNELRARGLALLAPYRSAKRDPAPQRSRFLSRLRYRIDTTFGQLVERYHAKRVWARDQWHLCSRLLRKVLSHTIATLLNAAIGNPPLQLARLLP